MTESHKTYDGNQPLTEGYQPLHKGYQPATPTSEAPSPPPSGGSSIMRPTTQPASGGSTGRK
jgi:hypothetical protein